VGVSWITWTLRKKKPYPKIGLFPGSAGWLEVADDVRENVADSRAEQGQNDDHHDGDQYEDL
jgi:hypothetical protein